MDLYFDETDYDEYSDDQAEMWHEDRVDDHCYPCGVVHWSRCCNWDVCEVDQVDEIVYEAVPESRTNKKISWSIMSFQWEMRDLPDNRGPAVLPYGKLDWVRRPEEDALCSEDREEWSEQPFRGAMTMAEWEREKITT